MATLNEVMKDTADAIREKTGKSEKIAPVNFAEEIKGITAGGGSGESGESNIEYFVYDKGTASAVATYAQYVKIEAMEGMLKAVMPYSPTTSEIIEQMGGEIKAFGVNLNERVLLVQGDVFRDSTILETLAENGITREKIDDIPRLTKEQFYTLE